MPTTRKRIVRKRVSAGALDLPEVARRLLYDLGPTWPQTNPPAEGQEALDWHYYALEFYQHAGPPTLEDYWLAHRKAVLAEWIATRPGTRPSCWWRFDSGLTTPRGETWCITPPADQATWLAEHGHLTKAEKKALLDA